MFPPGVNLAVVLLAPLAAAAQIQHPQPAAAARDALAIKFKAVAPRGGPHPHNHIARLVAAGDDNIISINDPANPPGAEDEPPANAVVVTMQPTSTALAAAATATSSSSPATESDNQSECRLLGSFAILVQLALGGLALLSLVYKRWRERPQRPVKIWFFDVSKQVFGSVLVHAANVFMSLLTSGRFSIRVAPEIVTEFEARMVGRGLAAVGMGGLMARGHNEPYVPNPCSFYLLNLAIDVSFSCSAFLG